MSRSIIIKTSIFFLYTLLSMPQSSKIEAGVNGFSHLVTIKGWVIERRIDLTTEKTICRASMPAYGTWFSARVRLDRNDDLITPDGINNIETVVSDDVLIKVRNALEECRLGILYLPIDY